VYGGSQFDFGATVVGGRAAAAEVRVVWVAAERTGECEIAAALELLAEEAVPVVGAVAAAVAFAAAGSAEGEAPKSPVVGATGARSAFPVEDDGVAAAVVVVSAVTGSVAESGNCARWGRCSSR
jgi:hypothetical protein